MNDRDNVIKCLELLYDRLLDAAKLDAIALLDASMVADAIAMLKEQKTTFEKDVHHIRCMTDRENIIVGLEHCKIGDCVGCPYDQIREESLHGKHDKWELVCNEQLTEDILTLLKEQEDLGTELTNAMELIHKKNKRIKKLQEQIETLTKWRMNAGAFD